MTVTEYSPDDLERLADRVLAMTPDRREVWLRMQPAAVVDLVEHAVLARVDPDGGNVYRKVGYEPICYPRVVAALEAGYPSAAMAQAAGLALPDPCGRCPQEQFDAAPEFDVFFGGAAGPGKSLSCLMLAVRASVRHPGFRTLFLRQTFDELDENVYPELRKIDHARAVGGHWNAGRKTLEFLSEGLGRMSEIRFRYMERLEDIERRQGGSYQLIVLDERPLMAPGTADGLRDRLRSTTSDIPVLGLRSTGNPGGRSHGEIKDLYVDATDHGDKILAIPTPENPAVTFDRRFIKAKATDNPYLPEEYYTVVLGGIADPVRRKAMAEGDFDIFVGQYFGEWRHDRHVVPRDAVEVQPGWPRSDGIDFGYAAPWCVLSGARDGDGRVWLYREIYEPMVGERDQARRVRDAERAAKERGVRRFADPSMWAKSGDADAVADVYKDTGVLLIKADNSRVIGWQRVHTFLSDGTDPNRPGEIDERYAACGYHRALGRETCPLLHVLEGTCPNLVRTLPSLPFDKHNVEDLDTDAEDHAADALRYLLMGQPLSKPRKRKPYGQQLRDAGLL